MVTTPIRAFRHIGAFLPGISRAILAVGILSTSTTSFAEDLRFNREVKPLLSDSCFRCHGPGVKKAGLRLDRVDVATKPLPDGTIAIVPGKPSESEIIARINSTDPEEMMPPPAA